MATGRFLGLRNSPAAAEAASMKAGINSPLTLKTGLYTLVNVQITW